ncbi:MULTISPECIES: GNAT family N-acetyltransferase [Achromobacter]|uniref:GNAT family N-acetyltransferase n=1 Tax=Achromobacter spanius TaxID=217203 RepID=A0ABY8GWL8_9BURK|nr:MULTISPECIES: GNAT family N-acetyltransferase [Achromobacter]WAI81838.1 GNAT family N-acetyltransferase [Achromobacter spanius]WEX91924.1 GNAT family N-acetyltransferase [Achromobacter sp. SS2-2022]WFP08928.1 GNAT family N-acetyltransferase [Achromobacter spanius]
MSAPQLVFRRARQEDLPHIVAMLADDELGATREDTSVPLNPGYTAAFAAITQDSNQFLAVVEQGQDLVGCLQLSFIPGLSRLGLWRGQIESVRIASSARGQGLGHAMFKWAIEQCRAQGCGLVQLTTDRARPDARRFYESLGFKASHDGMKLNL